MLLSKSLLLGRSTNRLGECCAHQKVAHQLIFGINPLRSLNTSLAFTSSPSVTTPTSKTTTNITTTTTATATANVTKSTQNEKEGKHLITVNSALFIDQLHGTIRPTIFDSSHHIYHNDVESIRYACEMASNHFLFRSGKSHTKEYQKIFTPLVVKRLYKDYLKEINRIPRPMERAQAKLELKAIFLATIIEVHTKPSWYARKIKEAKTHSRVILTVFKSLPILHRIFALFLSEKYMYMHTGDEKRMVEPIQMEDRQLESNLDQYNIVAVVSFLASVLSANETLFLLKRLESPEQLLSSALYTLDCLRRSTNPFSVFHSRSGLATEFHYLLP